MQFPRTEFANVSFGILGTQVASVETQLAYGHLQVASVRTQVAYQVFRVGRRKIPLSGAIKQARTILFPKKRQIISEKFVSLLSDIGTYESKTSYPCCPAAGHAGTGCAIHRRLCHQYRMEPPADDGTGQRHLYLGRLALPRRRAEVHDGGLGLGQPLGPFRRQHPAVEGLAGHRVPPHRRL